MISSWCRPRVHIATQCPTTTTETDASPSYLLRKEQQVLLCGGRRGMILPRVMSHERQSLSGLAPGWGRSSGNCGRQIVSELASKLFRRKPAIEMDAETGAETEESELTRTIGVFELSMFGVGATIGTGIFFVLSEAVPIAGPAVVISFVVAGVVAGLTAVCYAELASAVPVSGSSYSYAYATVGELPAMAVAACLLLEYGVSAAAVSVGWSQYLNQLLGNLFGIQIPEALSQAPEQGGILN